MKSLIVLLSLYSFSALAAPYVNKPSKKCDQALKKSKPSRLKICLLKEIYTLFTSR